MIQRTLAVAAVLLALSGAARAAERITNFIAEIQLAPSGVLTVRETIDLWAEGNSIRHGILRDFPTTYTDRLGRRVRVGFRVVSVQRDGADEPYEVGPIDAGERVRIGRADATVPFGAHRYVITYRTTRQVRYLADYDEVYWNATGNEWTFPIEHATAIIDLPQAARILQSAAYTGPLGSIAQAARVTRISETQIRFDTTAPLRVREGLTVAVGFTKGAVAPPSSVSRAFDFIRDNAVVVVALVGFTGTLIYYFVAWARVGRDPPRGVVIPLFSAPADLSPAAIRFIDRMEYDDKVYAAALINMAVKGFITIREAGGVYTLTRTDLPDASARLSGDERAIAHALGIDAPRQSIAMSRARQQSIHTSVSALRSWLRQTAGQAWFRTNWLWAYGGVAIIGGAGYVAAVVANNVNAEASVAAVGVWTVLMGLLLQSAWRHLHEVFRHSGWHIRALFRALGRMLLALALLAVAVPFLFAMRESLGVPAIIALAAGGGLVFAFRHLLTAPTPAGAKLLDQIEGFRMFLETAEQDRLETINPPAVTPEVFERFLPYAMALDCENEWARRFEAEAEAAGRPISASGDGPGYSPSWYSGSSGWGGISGFASDLGPSLAAATASAAASSSSSGSGGGGSAGGGGGGGGRQRVVAELSAAI